MDEARAAFLAELDQRRRRNGRFIVAALVAWAALYGLGGQMWESKAQPHVVAKVLGDLVLLFALALAYFTPWTKSQREALWRRRERRLQRAAPDPEAAP